MSNWIHHLQPAPSSDSLNAVACQAGAQIYLNTVRTVQADTELLFWYSRPGLC